MLYLLRHANSPGGGDDHARPIDALGRSRAEAIGARLAERGARIDAVLCSTARRARDTLEGLRTRLSLPEAQLERALYLARPGPLRQRLADLAPSAESALVIGHNPGLAELVADLGRPGDRVALAPASLAVLSLDIGAWAELAPGSGRLLELVDPEPVLRPEGG